MSDSDRVLFASSLIILAFVSWIGTGVFFYNRSIVAEPQYSRVIGDYVLNAEDSPTLEGWARYLLLAEQGMQKEGLTEDMFNSLFSWQQTPQNRMDFQYNYVHQMENLTANYLNQTRTQKISQFTDVYHQILDNLRTEANRNGALDWVAHGAWLIKTGNWWLPYYGFLAMFLGVVLFICGIAYWPEDRW